MVAIFCIWCWTLSASHGAGVYAQDRCGRVWCLGVPPKSQPRHGLWSRGGALAPSCSTTLAFWSSTLLGCSAALTQGDSFHFGSWEKNLISFGEVSSSKTINKGICWGKGQPACPSLHIHCHSYLPLDISWVLPAISVFDELSSQLFQSL